MSIKLITKAWETDFKGNDLLLLIALADSASDEGVCFPSWNTIREKTKISKGTLSYTLKAFEHFGIIERNHRKRENGSNKSNEYIIKIIDIDVEKFKKYKQKISSKNNQSSENELPPRVQNLNHPSSENEPYPSSENELAYEPSLYKPSLEPLVKEKINKKESLHFFELWNNLAKECNLTALSKITQQRFQKLNTRAKESKNFLEDFKRAIENIRQTPFLQGDNERGWKIDFDWLIKSETNFFKVVEGKYSKEGTTKEQTDFSRFGTAQSIIPKAEWENGLIDDIEATSQILAGNTNVELPLRLQHKKGEENE